MTTVDSRPVAAAVPRVTAPERLADALATRLVELGYDEPVVSRLRRLSGGASRETWSFEVEERGGRRTPLVLRHDPPGEPRPEIIRREAVALAAAAKNGVPVPRLVDHGDAPDVLGAPYLLLAHVEGESIARRILRDDEYAIARRRLAADLGRAAAAIHEVPTGQVAGIPAADGLSLLWERYLECRVPRPVIEVAFRWLEERRPDPVEAKLVHGDFRLGNVLVDGDGLAAVLDWELVHLGDPMEDLGYLCIRAWRFGGPRPVAGCGSFSQLFEAYVDAGGADPDLERVRWWQVAGTLSWAVGAIVQANRHFRGTTRSVELAAVGRRVVEQEHDLLRLMDEEE